MKNHGKWIFLTALFFSHMLVFAQTKKGNDKAMGIVPEFEKGWYLPYKGDTIKGEIQTNAGETETQFNISFFFKPTNAKKVSEITIKKAKAYGLGDIKFEILKIGETDYFAEVLEKGRIILYQINKEKMEKDRKTAIPVYYVTDTQADPKSKLSGMVELPKEEPYKKVLKELFKEQPMLIENVDKWFLQIDQVRQAIQEFNKLYQKDTSPQTIEVRPTKKIENGEEIEVEKIRLNHKYMKLKERGFILMPIDFTEQSLIAIKQSYNLERYTHSRIVLLHCYEKRGMERFEEMKKLAKQTEKESRLPTDFMAVKGNVYEETDHVAKEIGATLIMVGLESHN